MNHYKRSLFPTALSTLYIKNCVEKICENCVSHKFIRIYDTISIIMLAILANNISQIQIDFKQNVDIPYIVKNIFFFISAILFQKFSLDLGTLYSAAVREFYAANEKKQAQLSVKERYKDKIENPKKECLYIGLSLLFFLLYLFAIPIYMYYANNN